MIAMFGMAIPLMLAAWRDYGNGIRPFTRLDREYESRSNE